MSKIQTRFLGEIAVEAIGEVSVDGKPLSAPVIEYLVKYGLKQTVDDAGANPEKGKAGSQERLAALISGEVPSGGGMRLSIDERATRQALVLMLRKVGTKTAIAVKLASDVDAAIEAIAKAVKSDRVSVGAKVKSNAAKIAKTMREASEIEVEM